MTQGDDVTGRSRPELDALSSPYWAGAHDGRVVLQRCEACRRFQFYPRALCKHCFSQALGWERASGNGRLHSFSIIHRSADPAFTTDVPYVFAIVKLDEGPCITVNVSLADPDTLRCDQPVEVYFETAGEAGALPRARAI